jgi:hypothetical protein
MGTTWPDQVEQIARDNFIPLLPKLREYGLKKRETDTQYTLNAQDGVLDLEPKKRHAKPLETVPVTITLKDCDGEPLRNRTLLMKPRETWWGPASHNGKFSAPTVKTDSSGRATLDFTVGSTPGPAIARVYFSYLEPSGCENLNFNETVVNVDGARQYHGTVTFSSPVAETTGVAEVTWTLIDKSLDKNTEEDGEIPDEISDEMVDDEEFTDEDGDNEEWWYEASGTIRGTIMVPDCDPKHVELPIRSGSDGELAVNFEDKTYRFEFSADTEVTLMCGKPRRPWVISGASVFHYEGGLCPPGMSGLSADASIEDIMAAASEIKSGVSYTDVKTFKGEETCNTGMFGTTKWEFNAVM